MDQAEDIKPAQELVLVFQRARKNLRIYPVNNPVYSKTIEDAFTRIDDFLEEYGDLHLTFRQNEILAAGRVVYQSAGAEDNFAFLFFRDGVRELSFRRGLSLEEMRDFLQAISFDFERQPEDEDMVTMLWEKDFEHIKYSVDEKLLLEDETYEERAAARAVGQPAREEDLKRIYGEILKEEAAETLQAEIMPVTKADLLALQKDLERDCMDKLPRFVEILFDLFPGLSPSEYGEIADVINGTFEYCIKTGNLRLAVGILAMAEKKPPAGMEDGGLMTKELERVFEFACSPAVVGMLGDRLDAGETVEDDAFEQYVRRLDKRAVAPFITMLGELKTMEARRKVINALVFLGEKDFQALARGLSDDRWYVARNIIYIFRQIGDRQAIDFLAGAVHHRDERVRMEALKALGELDSQGMISVMTEALDDPEAAVRMTAVRALGRMKSASSKRAILERIGGKAFLDLDFNEKKQYFEALANWNDPGTEEFLLKALKSGSFFKKGRWDELRACAAYSLGLMGCGGAREQLEKLKDSKNRLLREYAYRAVKRIEHGR
ncbi:MAG: HEAT repeat domain-containing protein [Nitrospiraceae bacterium]|nr:HEAT repeat domain-containing protein [Nitrospiraceae bacterium]